MKMLLAVCLTNHVQFCGQCRTNCENKFISICISVNLYSCQCYSIVIFKDKNLSRFEIDLKTVGNANIAYSKRQYNVSKCDIYYDFT